MRKAEIDSQGCMLFAVFAPVFSGFYYFAGFLVCAIFLSAFFSPPLVSIENYGQFGFLAVYFGFFGLLAGISTAVLPLSRFTIILWIPIICAVRFLAIAIDFESSFRALNSVVFVAQIVLDVLFIVIGIVISFLSPKLFYRS